MLLKGRVVAVSCDHAHRFSKLTRSVIRLIAGHGVEGDVHAGRFVKHRYLARRDPEIPNIRQILLIPAELFEGVQGPRLNPGQLGENIQQWNRSPRSAIRLSFTPRTNCGSCVDRLTDTVRVYRQISTGPEAAIDRS